MLTAIYFNYETLFQTDKVGYVKPNRMLPSELELLKVPIPEQSPKPQLGVGQGFAKLSCSLAKLW